MKETTPARIKIRRTRTIQTAPYESFSIEVSHEADAEEGETPVDAMRRIRAPVLREVRLQEKHLRAKMLGGDV